MKSSLDISVLIRCLILEKTILECFLFMSFSATYTSRVVLIYLFLVECILCPHKVFDFLGSWVQLQMQNHPAELWEDGIKDYLSHASEIMVSFAGCKWTIFPLFHSCNSCN